MNHAHQTRMMVGVGTAVGAVMVLGSVLVGCAPGTICDKAGYEEQCMNPVGGTGGSGGGGSGGSGGSGGTGGSRDGGGMEAAGATVGPSTAVANCTMYPTVGKMDDFFKARCGTNSACHDNMIWTDMKSANAYTRMIDKPANFTCRTTAGTTKLINKQNWRQSFIYVKTHEMMPGCPDGSTSPMLNTIMPPPASAQPAGSMIQGRSTRRRRPAWRTSSRRPPGSPRPTSRDRSQEPWGRWPWGFLL